MWETQLLVLLTTSSTTTAIYKFVEFFIPEGYAD